MINQIIFLGTAGDSFVAGKQTRASGGIIIRIGDVQLHLDPGPGAVVKAKQVGVNLRANTAVLVSNSSILHSNDVNAVIDAMTYGGIDKKGVLVANKSTINGTEKENPKLTNKHKSLVEKIVVMDEHQKLGIENVEIHSLPTESSDESGIGFKILAPNFTLVYTSDTKYSKDLVKEYKGADILVLNVPLPSSEKSDSQLNSESAIKIIKKSDPKLAIINHFGIKMIKADPLYEGREIQKKTGTQVLVAKDGMALGPESYSAHSPQIRLNKYKDQDTGEIKSRPEKKGSKEEPVKEKKLQEPKKTKETQKSDKENSSSEDKKKIKEHQSYLEDIT